MLASQSRSSLERGLASLEAADDIEALLARFTTYGSLYFVDTVNGSDLSSGQSAREPFATVAKAFTLMGDEDVLFVLGDVREEVLSPLGVFGCKIVGAASGRPRHSTEGGVAVSGNGASWREPASGATTGGALLTLRQQGWEVHNLLFVPKSDATALRLRRAEDATYPDGSHAVVSGCRFIVGTAATTKGVEDHGGLSHVTIRGCEFDGLADAISHTTGAGIAAPNLYVIEDSYFLRNTNHIVLPCDRSIVRRNVVTHATANIDVSGGLVGLNFTLENQLSEAAASVTIANGYDAGTDGVWRNYATDAIDYSVPS